MEIKVCRTTFLNEVRPTIDFQRWTLIPLRVHQCMWQVYIGFCKSLCPIIKQLFFYYLSQCKNSFWKKWGYIQDINQSYRQLNANNILCHYSSNYILYPTKYGIICVWILYSLRTNFSNFKLIIIIIWMTELNLLVYSTV